MKRLLQSVRELEQIRGGIITDIDPLEDIVNIDELEDRIIIDVLEVEDYKEREQEHAG